MPGLLDIAPPEIGKKSFTIRGGTIEVRGLRNREMAALSARFPDMDRPGANSGERTVAGLDAQIAAIAAALDKTGDEATESAIKERLTDAEIREVFEAIAALGDVPLPLADGPVFETGHVPNGRTTRTMPRASSS